MIRTFRPIPLKQIKLVLFDLDGTLIDSELDLAASVNAMPAGNVFHKAHALALHRVGQK